MKSEAFPGTVSCLFVFFLALPLAGGEIAPPRGFTALFDGKTLTGWHGMGHFDPRKLWAMSPPERALKRAADLEDFQAHWSIETGVDGVELINDGHGPYATTDDDYGDIELLVEYRTVPRADSGIYLRATPQVQIWDTTEAGGKWKLGADRGSGGLWNNTKGRAGKDPLVHADRPFGEWNRLRMIQIGSRTTVYLNERRVVDHAILENYWDRQSPLFRRGPIQLQTHGGEIRWRHIFIREILPLEANALLFQHELDDFRRVFNGRDLGGWQGAVENYEVLDGAIQSKKGKGGNLFTTREYSDFVARFEFKLGPGGNSGLCIRFPGGEARDTAYEGMCEIQVLDDNYDVNTGEKLDPRQVHGSVYGIVGAHRGYQNPPGEWNFQEVRVQGSSVRVELNGTVILDADLSKITDFMKSRERHPGLDNKTGFFGFAGHGSQVAFRNIWIRELQ